MNYISDQKLIKFEPKTLKKFYTLIRLHRLYTKINMSNNNLYSRDSITRISRDIKTNSTCLFFELQTLH